MELPEVEVMRRDLQKEVVGRRIEDVEVRSHRNTARVIRRHRGGEEFRAELAGTTITTVDRRGKYVLFHVERDGAGGRGRALVVHFGMSGQFVRGTKKDALSPHTHVVLEFLDGGDLRYVDPRTFGELFVASAGALGEVKELAHIAIDPLSEMFTRERLAHALARRTVRLKPLLMDQTFVSGIGNIYSDEVLFDARLRHDRPSNSLSSREVLRLYRSLREVVRDAVQHRGTTLGDQAYVDLFGNAGEFQSELKVYGRKGLSCARCGAAIGSVKLSGRTSYFCPRCQR